MDVDVLDPRVKSAVATIGVTMLKELGNRGWSPPMLAALSDDGKTIRAVLVEGKRGSVTRDEWFAEAHRTLQQHINEGATTILAGIISDVKGLMPKDRMDNAQRKGVIVLGMDRYRRFGTVYLVTGQHRACSLGLDKFKEDVVSEAFELLFETIAWPVVH